MLHIYWAEGASHEQEAEFEARVVSADIVISDTLKLLKSMTNHDALYTLMSKLVLLRGKQIYDSLIRG